MWVQVPPLAQVFFPLSLTPDLYYSQSTMESISQLLLFTRSDSSGSIIVRGLIWLIAVLILAAGIDSGKHYSKIKADAGWFFLFVFSAGLTSYFLFGFAPTF